MSDQYSEDDNGVDNQTVTLEPVAMRSGILQNPANEGTIFTRIQQRRYICGACGKEKPEQKINKHHAKNHSDVPFTMTMYELCEIDERIQCLICNADELELDFDKHMNDCHPEIYNGRNDENVPSNVIWQIMPVQSQLNNDYLTANWCPHTMYDETPPNDVFQIIQHQQKTLCDDCGKQLKKPTGFRNVCISDTEFHRFLSHNRIYHSKGRLYLKDSK